MIRKISEKDTGLLFAILDQFKREIGENDLGELSKKEIRNAILTNRITFYGIFEEELIAICSLSKCFSTYKASDIAMLDDVFVAKKFRKQGYLRKLINFVKEDAINESISSIMLGSSENDIEMYKSIGFQYILGTMMAMDIVNN